MLPHMYWYRLQIYRELCAYMNVLVAKHGSKDQVRSMKRIVMRCEARHVQGMVGMSGRSEPRAARRKTGRNVRMLLRYKKHKRVSK